MTAHVKTLSDFDYKGRLFDTLYVIRDERGMPAVLPLLFAAYLSSFGIIHGFKDWIDGDSRKRRRQLVETYVSDRTIRSYIYKLANFLSFLDATDGNRPGLGMHNSAGCSPDLINRYINDELAHRVESSASLDGHRSALAAYFSWLDYMEIRPWPDLQIRRSTRKGMAERSTKPHHIQYISRRSRRALLGACENLGEKLILRMGFEVGLRTSEVSALQLEGKGKLEELFSRLDAPEHQHVETFNYQLEGKYTKGGRTRTICFDRALLVDMRRYARSERKQLLKTSRCKTNTFFLRTDHRGIGQPISKQQASNVFRRRAIEAQLNPLYHFHDLRHTFATELYHSELQGRGGRIVGADSQALITVALRLGHKLRKNGQPSSTTIRYVRLRMEMLEIEDLE